MTRTDLLRLLAALSLAPLLAACSGEEAISGVSPAHGSARGGEKVILRGHFGSSPTVRFGDREAKVESATATRVEVIAPRSIAGAVDVVVQSGDREARLDKGYTYEALPLALFDAAWARLPAIAVDGGSAAIADGDGDGHPDVFQAARGEGGWIYPGDGKGGFGQPLQIHVEGDPIDARSIVAADLDGDGHVDLFLGATGATASRVLFGDGKFGFKAAAKALPPLFGSDQQAVAVDLDGDGDLDLVTVGSASAGGGAPGVSILLNKGHRVFADVTATRLAGGTFGASGVAVGDVDGDGDPDLFFAADQEPCRLYLNDGKGSFERAAPDAIPYDPKPGVGSPAMGDLDGDGSLDLYLPSAGQDHLLVNDGTGHYTDLTDVRLGPDASSGQRATLVDLDLDGHLDVAVVDRAGALRLHRNDGTGRLFDYSGDIAGNGAALPAIDVAAGDLDGDGVADLFVSRPDLARPSLLVNWSPLSLPDEDGDGIPDAIDNCPAVANPDQQNLDSLPFHCASAASCQAETGCSLHVYERSAYLLCPTAPSWDAAVAACKARDGALITVTDAGENAFLTAIGATDAFIGYTDAAVEGTFVWASGSSSYVNWAMGQPDDSGGNEDCAVLLADGTWNDVPCASAHAYVCKTARAKAPDPGDACDACPTIYEPGSKPVDADAGACGELDGGMP